MCRIYFLDYVRLVFLSGVCNAFHEIPSPPEEPKMHRRQTEYLHRHSNEIADDCSAEYTPPGASVGSERRRGSVTEILDRPWLHREAYRAYQAEQLLFELRSNLADLKHQRTPQRILTVLSVSSSIPSQRQSSGTRKSTARSTDSPASTLAMALETMGPRISSTRSIRWHALSAARKRKYARRG